LQAVILAGGFGTRLRPLTSTRPKPLIPFANEPFLLHMLRQLAASGFNDVVLSTMYLPEAFDELIPAARKAGVEVVLSSEDTPMGTSGAVKRLSHLLDDTFLVFNGDILIDLDLAQLVAMHKERSAAATLALVRVPDPSAFGLVPIDADGRVQAFLEKPGPDEEAWVTDLINAGVYVLEPSVLEHVPAGQPSSFERNLFPSLLASGAPVYGYEVHGYWRDLGTPIAYLAAQADLLEGRLNLPISATERGRGQWFSDAAEVEPGAVLRGPLMIGPGAKVEREGRVFGPSVLGPRAVVAGGARVERSVLLAGARIERGAKVTDSIVGANVVVGSGAVITDGAILGDGVVIDEGNLLAAGVRVAPGVHLPRGAIRV
jgi:mannose-1-phosphate guanylyltransferase / phosphomannomutase